VEDMLQPKQRKASATLQMVGQLLSPMLPPFQQAMSKYPWRTETIECTISFIRILKNGDFVYAVHGLIQGLVALGSLQNYLAAFVIGHFTPQRKPSHIACHWTGTKKCNSEPQRIGTRCIAHSRLPIIQVVVSRVA
jgi:hypothetical protein